jgi:hypothetical protein
MKSYGEWRYSSTIPDPGYQDHMKIYDDDEEEEDDDDDIFLSYYHIV